VIQYADRRGFYEYATDLPNSVGEVFKHLGYYSDILTILGISEHSAKASRNRHAQGYSANNLGATLLELRDFKSAESYFLLAKGIYDEVGDELGSTVSAYHLARLLVERGEYRKGINALLAARNTFRRLDAQGAEVNALRRLAEAHRQAGDPDSVIAFAQEGLWLAGRIGDEMNQAVHLTELGSAFYEKGDLTTSRRYSEQALALHRRLSGFALAARSSMVIARVHNDLRDSSTAEQFAQSAADFARTAHDSKNSALANRMLGELLHDQGRHEEAIEAWSKSLITLEEIGDPLADSVRQDLTDLRAVLPIVPPEQTRPLMTDTPTQSIAPRAD
jgi:tetratricopeptide (TPR) repeat protein